MQLTNMMFAEIEIRRIGAIGANASGIGGKMNDNIWFCLGEKLFGVFQPGQVTGSLPTAVIRLCGYFFFRMGTRWLPKNPVAPVTRIERDEDDIKNSLYGLRQKRWPPPAFRGYRYQ